MGIIELLPLLMFVALAFLLFSGFPVAWVLGGVGLGFGLIGIVADELNFIQFSTLPSRIFGGVMENLILTAIPMFVFMGTMLEKSGVARDLVELPSSSDAACSGRSCTICDHHGDHSGSHHRYHWGLCHHDEPAGPADHGRTQI